MSGVGCLITDAVNFAHLGKIEFARFLQCKVTIFPSVTNSHVLDICLQIFSQSVACLFFS